jgi:ADP-L-glycero-D-manno-heptose 6-epimerase
MKTKIKNDQLIVVTGAAGFIASGIVRYLNDLGLNNLILVDNIGKTDKWKNLLGKQFVDFLGIEQLFPWIQGRENEIQAFIHLGACSDTLETDGDYLMENNYRYTVKLAEYALTYNKRFIYASSAATYGDGALGFSDDHALLDQLQPLNLYGFSKHLFDLWAKQQGVLDRIVGLKYFNIFGPNEQHKGRMASMIYKMLPQVLSEGVVRLFKSTDPDRFPDGGQCRDFLYGKDAVRMTCQFLENELSGIFNIGRGEATTWNTLATALFQAADKQTHIEYIEMPSDLAKQYQNYTCADMQKYCRMHGYASPSEIPFEYTVETAVEDNVRNHLLKDTRW